MERQWTLRNTTIEGPHWKCPSSPKPTNPNQQRERAEASIGSDHQNPSRTARKQRPPPSLPARAGRFPRPHTPNQQRERAGASIGSDHQNPSRTARKQRPPPSLPARAGRFPRPHTPNQQRERAGASIGSDHQNPSRTARKQRSPPSLPASAGTFPRPLPQTHAKKNHVPSESRVPQPWQHKAHDLPAVKQDPPRCPPWQHPSLQNRGLI